MTFTPRTVRTADGLSLYVRDYAAVGEKSGVPVMCIHGLTRNSADFEEVAPGIAETGRRVLAVDVRGRGRSQYDVNPENYRGDIYAQDVIAILDRLRIPEAVFLGTSMGGIITMMLASAAPERIVAAILNDIGPELDPAGLARIAGYVGKARMAGSWEEMTQIVKTGQAVCYPHADDAFWHTFVRRVSEELSEGRIGFAYDPAIANAFRPDPDAPPSPSMVPLFKALSEKPVLVVRGESSDLLSRQGVETMKTIKPDLEFVEVPGVGHAPTLEEAAAARAIADFLSRVP